MISALPLVVEEGRLSVSSRFAAATHGVTKRYGKVLALRDVELRVPEGSVYILVGSNGAGKTTLLEILLDLVRPNAGTAEVLGLDVSRRGAEVRAQVGYVSSRPDWGYQWMPVGHLIRHHSAFYPSWDHTYAQRLIDLFTLPLDQRFGTLSKGYARRVQLVMALAHRPALLLLDEPTDGLDRVVRDELMGILSEHLAESPTTVLVSTHLIYEVEPLADYLGMLSHGKLVAQLPRERLHRMLRQYRAVVPPGWRAPERLEQTAIHRAGGNREIQWTIWGDEANVSEQLTQAGALLRDVSYLTLDAAVLALLRYEMAKDQH